MKNAGTFTITTPTDREIVLTRVFDGPRAAVFVEHVKHWWDPSGVPLLKKYRMLEDGKQTE
jgi:hypothetical protein